MPECAQVFHAGCQNLSFSCTEKHLTCCSQVPQSSQSWNKRSVTWDKMAQIWCVPRGWRAQNQNELRK
jgi:hypothetical protein